MVTYGYGCFMWCFSGLDIYIERMNARWLTKQASSFRVKACNIGSFSIPELFSALDTQHQDSGTGSGISSTARGWIFYTDKWDSTNE